MTAAPYGTRLATWERRVEWPLTAAAVVFFAAYAADILVDPADLLDVITETAIWVTWAVFLADYVSRLALAERRGRWFSRHLLDLAIVVLPMLRPLRLMRFLTIIALIQRGAGSKLRGRVFLYTIGATALTVVIAGLAVYDAERSAGNISSFGDAVWWAFVTITTVGYGDYYPASLTGRIVAVALMVGGIALIGVVTATLASWIVERVAAETQPAATATEEQVEALRGEIAELKSMMTLLSQERSPSTAEPSPDQYHARIP